MIASLIIYVLIILVTLAYAIPAASEHADDIIMVEWKMITIIAGLVVGLLTLLQALISYIYISGIKDIKQSIEKLFDNDRLLEHNKLDKLDHAILCGRVNEKG